MDSRTITLESVIASLGSYTEDAILITEPEIGPPAGPRVLWCNPAFTRMTGYAADEIVGQTPRLLQGPETSAHDRARLRDQLSAWRPVRGEILNYRRDRTPFWVELAIEPVCDDTGWVRFWVAVQRDITERKAAERRLAETAAAARAASEAKSLFLASMSHEIRTPLNGVLGMADVLAHTNLDESQRGYLETIQESGRLLLAVLNDIIDFARIEQHRLTLEVQAFALAPLVQRVAQIHRFKAIERGLAFEVEVTSPPDERRLGDEMRVQQILHNLLSNAVKFTDAGSVRLTVSAAPAGIRIEVADSGIGISPDHLDRLFEPFDIGQAGPPRREGGTGLGLAIVKGLVTAMQGTIAVESRPGNGSRFVVDLPLPVARAASAAPRRRRILSVEDNELNRRVLHAMLMSYPDIELTFAEDGRQGVEVFKTGNWDLVFMDSQMPVMDGLTATRLIREHEAATGARRTPIVVLTGNVLDHQVATYGTLGFDGFLAKPIERPKLAAILARVSESPDAQI